MLRLSAAVLVAALNLAAADSLGPLPLEKIVQSLVAADEARLSRLDNYTAHRKYSLVNQRFGKRGELLAKLFYRKPGEKRFEYLSESGSTVVVNRILKRMPEAEADAAQTGNRQKSRFLPGNYDFQLLGMDSMEGRRCYVLKLSPRTEDKYLVRGKIWVDAVEFAVVHLEGSPAKNPSFWIKGTTVVQSYGKFGAYWFPVLNQSTTEARIFGKTDVTIAYSNYEVNAQ